MTFERDIKDALIRHQDDVQVRHGFGEVETKVRRAHARRLGAVSALAVAAVVAGAVTWALLPNDAPRGFDNPSATVTPTPATPPETRTYVETVDRWRVSFPSDWRATRFEGETEFLPPGLPGTTADDDTFAVNVQWFGSSSGGPGSPYPGAAAAPPLDGEDVTIGDFEASRVVRERDRDVVYRIRWCVPSDPEHPDECSMGQLRMAILASTQELWDTYHEQAEVMIRTLGRAEGSFSAGATDTRHGSVRAGVGGGDDTYALVRFLEARIDGAGADRYLTDNAKQQYTSDTSGVGLYENGLRGEPEDRWASYTVVQRDEADANSSEFVVDIVTAGDVTVRERIGVGFSDGQMLIRFATREDA